MEERPYTNREHDAKHQEIIGALTRVEEQIIKVVEQTTITNGKVKRITLALVLLFGISLGLGSQYAPLLLSMIL